MKAFYLWLILLAGLGVTLGIFLFLTPEELALVLLKERHYEASEKVLRRQYLLGGRATDVVIPLKSLELKKGNVEEAIEIMEEYVKNNPNDIQAREVLALLYLSHQEPSRYIQALEEIVDQQSSPAALRRLGGWYQFLGRSEGQIEVLRKIVLSKKATPDEYIRYASLLAAKGDYRQAIAVLEEFHTRFPKVTSPITIGLHITLLLKLSEKEGGKPALVDDAMQLALNFLNREKDPKNVARIISIFIENNHAFQAGRVASVHLDKVRNNQNALTTALQAIWLSGERKQVVAELVAARGQMPLEGQLANFFVLTMVQEKNQILLSDFLDSADVNELSETTLLNIVEASVLWNQPELALQIKERIDPKELLEMPALVAAIELAIDPVAGSKIVEEMIQSPDLSIREKVSLLNIALNQKQPKLALDIARQMTPFIGLTQSELIYVAEVFIRNGQAEEGFQLFQANAEKIGKANVSGPEALFQLALGDPEPAKKWLVDHPDATPDVIEFFYLNAAAAKENEFALEVATTLYEKYKDVLPPGLAEAYYGQALMDAGKVLEAIAFYEYLLSKSSDQNLKQQYFTSLARGVKAHPEAEEKLREFISRELKNPDAPKEFLRDMAYVLLEIYGDTEVAETIFLRLGAEESPDSEDIRALVYLWGPRPPEKAKQWIVKRAEDAKGEDFGPWLADLLYIGAYRDVIQLFEEAEARRPLEASGSEALFNYLVAAIKLKLFNRAHNAACNLFHQTEDVEKLKEIALLIQGSALQEIERLIWEKIVMKEPGLPSNWEALATVQFNVGDLSAAYCNYLHYFSLLQSVTTKEVRPFANFGSILEERNLYKDARQFYLSALCLIDQDPNPSQEMLETQARLFFQIDREKKGIVYLVELYRQAGYPPALQASLMNMLMDAGYLGRATRLSRCPNG